MEHEDIEVAEKLEGIGDGAIDETMKKAFSFSWEQKAQQAEERIAGVSIDTDEAKYNYPPVEALTPLPEGDSGLNVQVDAQPASTGLVDALSRTIDALQEVFAELTEAKTETLAVAQRATEKATRAGIELDLSLLDDPFDMALTDVNRLLNTLEKQRNRARMAASA